MNLVEEYCITILCWTFMFVYPLFFLICCSIFDLFMGLNRTKIYEAETDEVK